MTFKDFKGQVKISDVQDAFDNLVDRINASIDTYNESSYVTDINYNDVSEELAPLNYTLSVGGLKKILETYDGCVIGCKVFRIENNLNITSGLLIKRDGCIQLPSAVIPAQGKYLFYSPSLKQYKYPESYIYKTSDWEMPSISSDESWGTMTVSDYVDLPGGRYSWNFLKSYTPNEPRLKAWRVTTGDGYLYGGGNDVQDVGNFPYHLVWTWLFKQAVALTNITFNVDFKSSNTGYNLRVVGRKNGVDTVLHSETFTTATKQITVDMADNKESYDSMRIEFDTTAGRNFAISGSLSSLRISGSTVTKIPIEGSGDADDWIQICKLNYNRDVALSNTYEFDAGNIQNYKITSQSKNTSFNTSEGLDTSSAAKFIGGCQGGAYGSGNRSAYCYLLGEEVAYSLHPSNSTAGSYYIYNKLLVPKGVGNPYTYTANTTYNQNNQRVCNVIVTRK